MKTLQNSQNWFFVDEAGDPTFYDRRGNYLVGQDGCSPILLLGFIETPDPKPISAALLNLQHEIVNDPYFQGVPSLEKTALAFHAKDDLPEIRLLVYRLLATLEFNAQFIVARKIERVFRNSFAANELKFYDHLVTQLFKNALHQHQENAIYFAKRGSRNRQVPLEVAIREGVQQSESRQVESNITVQSQTPLGEPCLSVIDYMNWAVYRAFTRGEMRYYRTMAEKVSLLVDLYDSDRYPQNWYDQQNPFDIEKITPL